MAASRRCTIQQEDPTTTSLRHDPSAELVERRMLGLLIGFCALLGLVVGSFLNVVIYRVPRDESIVSPRSSCPACGTPIRERDNIPVVVARAAGRCRDCRRPISARYPLVELACGALFAGTAARFGHQWDLPAYLVLFAGLLALSCIDVERMILPKKIVYPLTLLVAALLALAAARPETGTPTWSGSPAPPGGSSCSSHEPCQSPILGVRGRAAFSGSGPLAGVAGCWLRPTRIFRREPHRFGGRDRPVATKRIERQSRIPYGVFLAAGCACRGLRRP